MLQPRIENESAKIGGARFNSSALKFQYMTKLQMGVGNLGSKLERFSIGVFGFYENSGLLQSVAVLHPYRGIVRLLVKRLSVVLCGHHPVSRVPRSVRSGDEPRSRARNKTRTVPDRLQNASRQRGP